MVDIVQLVRTSDCGSEGRGFESHYSPKWSCTQVVKGALCKRVIRRFESYQDLKKFSNLNPSQPVH